MKIHLRNGDWSFQEIDQKEYEKLVGTGKIVGSHLNQTNEIKEKEIFGGVYKLRSDGKIFSKYQQNFTKVGVTTSIGDSWKELKIFLTRKGYPVVTLNNKQYRLHRLLAENFIPNPAKYKYVLHKDDNKQNYSLDNLYWGTHQMNMDDRKQNNNNVIGSKNSQSKLTEREALEIFNKKLSLNKLAKLYNVSKRCVLFIKQKKTWKHIHDDLHINYLGSNQVVFARGEMTNHTHIIKTAGNMTMHKLPDGSYVISLDDDAVATHPEHSMKVDLKVPKKKYLLYQRREKDWFSLKTRRVID